VRVFVAGASGAIGRPLMRCLLQAGHTPTGMSRRAEAAEEIRADGADAVVVDVFDREALNEAVAGAKPEVVVHQLTAYPARLDPRDPDVYAGTERLRTEGTRNLLAAATSAGARRIVAQSIAFIYEPVGSPVKDEEAAILSAAAGPFGSAVAAAVDLERQVMGTPGIEGVVLRYGFFYGPGTHYAADGYYADQFHRRRFPIVGSGDATYSFIHVDDAVAATVAAVEHGEPGIYNVTDDDPARVRVWAPVYAEALGAKPPRQIPKLAARVAAGAEVTGFATTMRGASNAKAKRELDWQPLHSSWREGFRESLRARG
jgi:nucleoside-diphosphate-sugar epimerase